MSTPVSDPFGVTADPVLVSLGHATDPARMQSILDRGVAALPDADAVRLDAVRVIRYKPERRCLIEYDVSVTRAGATEALTLIGKLRRNRPGRHQHRLLQAFWDAGFDGAAPDAICVPQPMGEVPELAMWLQRRVAGIPATELLAGPRGVALAPRLAEAAHKIHCAAIPTPKRHGVADELRILHACLEHVASARPHLAARLDRLVTGSRRAARLTPALPAVGIHRDYYADQVVVDGDRLTVVDFDLYTTGDPALDVGNLLGHVTEHSLRELGDPDALAPIEHAVEDRFAALAGEATRGPVRLYAALTLARHVFLAYERLERRSRVDELLDIAAERVDAQVRSPTPA